MFDVNVQNYYGKERHDIGNDLVDRFRVEDQYYTEIEQEKRKIFEKGDFEHRLTRARQDLDHARDDVYGVEYDFVGFKNERQAVSPRAVRQGFTDALDANVKDYRDKVTWTKHDCIFKTEFELRELEEERDRVTREFQVAFENMRRCQERREAELTGLWKRDSERKWQLNAFAKRTAIADQRKWQS